mmetsp:Transcript_8892/g.27584  ORF Transcript_8892/g.27584 Transcript_8892/m.27584 type:complete len:240 (-) Transcript_8892:72-791(-)
MPTCLGVAEAVPACQALGPHCAAPAPGGAAAAACRGQACLESWPLTRRMSCSLVPVQAPATCAGWAPCVASQAARSSAGRLLHSRAATRRSSSSRADLAISARRSARSVQHTGHARPHTTHHWRSSAKLMPCAPLSTRATSFDSGRADAGGGGGLHGPAAWPRAGCFEASRTGVGAPRAASCTRRRLGLVSVSKASRASRKRSAASGASHLSGCHWRACPWKARLTSASAAPRGRPSTA